MITLYDAIRQELHGPYAPNCPKAAVVACREHILVESQHNTTLSRRLFDGVDLWIPVTDTSLLDADGEHPTIKDLKALIGFVPYKEYKAKSPVPSLLRFTATGFMLHALVRAFKRGVEGHPIQFVEKALYLDDVIARLGFDEERRQDHLGRSIL